MRRQPNLIWLRIFGAGSSPLRWMMVSLISAILLLNTVFGQDQTNSLLDAAQTYLDSNHWDSAIYIFEEASALFRQNDDWKNYVETKVKLNKARLSAIDYETAKTDLNLVSNVAFRELSPDDLTMAHLFDVQGKLAEETADYADAVNNLTQSLRIKQNLQLNDEDIAGTYYDLGNVYRGMGDLAKAMDAFDSALKIRERIYGPDSYEAASVSINIATIYKNRFEFEEALSIYLRCDSIILEKFGPDHQARASILNGIAIIYAQSGQYPEALEYFSELLAIDQKTLGENDPNLARTYTNLGILHELMGDYKTAQDLHKKSLAIKLKSFEPDNPNLSTDYKSLGVIMSHIGDIDQSLLYFRQALLVDQQNSSDKDPALGVTHNMISSALAKKGDYENAWEEIKKAETIFLQNGKNFVSLGPVYHTMASFSEEQGNYQDALVYAYKAIAINRQAGEDHPHVAGNHIMIGNIFEDLGKIDSALYHYQIALDIKKKIYGKKHLEISNNYGVIAQAYFAEDSIKKSLEEIQKSLIASTDSFDEIDITKNPSPEQTLVPSTVASFLGIKGKILNYASQQQQNDELLYAAMSTFDSAIAMIDAAQFSYKSQGSVLSLREELDPVFEEAIDVAYQLYINTKDIKYLEKAFQISEKNKAALLVTAINESRAQAFAGIPDSLVEKENKLHRDLTYTEQLLSEEKMKEDPDQNTLQKLQGNIFSGKSQYDQLIEFFNENYPRYFQLKYDKKPISLHQVQSRLNNNELLIEYYLGSEKLYIFALSEKESELHRLDLPPNFIQMISDFKLELANSGGIPNSFFKKSHELYELLIQPFATILQNQKITFIPDGELGYIPFEILTGDAQNHTSFNLPYLLNNHTISYAFSATYLEEQTIDETDDIDLKFLAFAPNFNSRNDEGSPFAPDLLASREAVRGSLSELNGAAREVESLSQYFPGVYLQNEKATETGFKDLAENYGIIHLATHAIIDEVNPLNSRLLFTIDGDSINDGDLNAWELFNMQLNAKLAVLSACNTGFGKIQKGEGVLSLGRAFAYAGCPSRLMSLWPAQDASTADIMIKFYEYLADGRTKDDALRQAKLDYLKNAAEFNQHPFYWAGFVLQGDPSPIIEKSYFVPFALGFLGLALLGYFIWKRN